MQNVDKTTLAYLAGMIDGDGFISITRSSRNKVISGKEYYGAQVGISGTMRQPHDLASSIWGGSVSCYKPKNPFHRPQYQWARMGKSAIEVIEAIYPYLRIKKEHAELAIELQDLVAEANSDDPFPWFSPNYDPLPEMRKLREQMIELNQSRNKTKNR